VVFRVGPVGQLAGAGNEPRGGRVGRRRGSQFARRTKTGRGFFGDLLLEGGTWSPGLGEGTLGTGLGWRAGCRIPWPALSHQPGTTWRPPGRVGNKGAAHGGATGRGAEGKGRARPWPGPGWTRNHGGLPADGSAKGHGRGCGGANRASKLPGWMLWGQAVWPTNSSLKPRVETMAPSGGAWARPVNFSSGGVESFFLGRGRRSAQTNWMGFALFDSYFPTD